MASKLLGILLALYAVNSAYSQICRIDIGIILDDSGSIKHWGFEQEKKFIRDLTRQLRVSGDNTRVSVMTFSTNPRMRIFFRDRSGQDWNSLNWALNGVRHSGGWTYTDRALHLARNQMFNTAYGSRSGAPKMLLLLTDGRSQSGHSKLSHAATLLKNNFVNIISIGVGYSVRRSELELIASRPINQHVFQVRDAGALNRIVNVVRTEACKPITCWFIDCIYNNWSSWSRTCEMAVRTRTVRLEVRKSKMVVGGCAGLNVQKCRSKHETKNLGYCLRECKYVKCLWGPWSAWSATCGIAKKTRSIKAHPATTKRRNCHGLPQRCYQKPEALNRFTQCTCNYVECRYGEWSRWSTSCGNGQRSRQMQTIRKTAIRANCNGLPTSCPGKPQVQTRTETCTCKYVDCQYGPWSQWTTTCGKGERARKLKAIPKTKQANSCNGLPQTCSTTPDVEKRTQMCTCKYVECPYGPWSEWTTTCGKGQRARKQKPTPKTKQAISCNGLTQTCSAKPDVQQRTEMCKCNYVECKYTDWSEWKPNCGKNMKRSRTLQTIKKVIEKESCDGLPQSCTGEAEQTEKKDELCECDTVKCVAQWSAWSASCGLATRVLRFVKVPIKVKKESCEGLQTTCSNLTETQTDDLFCEKTQPPVTTPPPSDATCGVVYKSVGCFKRNKEAQVTFSETLFIDKRAKGDHFPFKDYLSDLVCSCATKAKFGKHSFFVVLSTGQCLAGKAVDDNWGKHSSVDVKECNNSYNQQCSDKSSLCIGAKRTLFAYKVEN